MTRVRRGYTARRRRTKIRLFASTSRGAHSRLTRTITQQKMRALASSHRDRGRQKRDFRRLWITRINAVTRDNKVYLIITSYCIYPSDPQTTKIPLLPASISMRGSQSSHFLLSNRSSKS